MPVDITATPRREQYAISGGGPYPFDFEILEAADLAVYRDATLLSFPAHYTVTIGSNGKGSISLLSATGTTLTIVGARLYRRVTSFPTGGDFKALDVNREFSSLQIQIQQLLDMGNRALRVPTTEVGYPDELPSVALRGGRWLYWDAEGHVVPATPTATNLAVSAYAQTLLDDLDAAAARDTLGGVREKLTGARTYYVRTDGNDANDGLSNSAGGAFLTPQRAIDVIHQTLDFASLITVEVAAGAYTEGIVANGAFTGGGVVLFNAPAYPIVTSITDTICVEAVNGAELYFTGGFEFHGETQGLFAWLGGKIHFAGCVFAEGGADQIQIYATRLGYIEAQTDYIMSGGGLNHVQASHQGNFRQSSGTLILVDDVTFTHASYYALTEADITFTGNSTVSYGGNTCTAKKFIVSAATIQWASQVADAPLGSLPGEEYSGGRFLGATDQTDTFIADFTLDMTATGDQAITMPLWAHEISWMAAKDASTAVCLGTTVGLVNHALVNAHVAATSAWSLVTNACIYVYDATTGDIFEAAVTARTHTSVTITKAKTGTPTGTLKVSLVGKRRS